MKITNNFSSFKSDFTTDLGLDPDQHKELYVQYVSARWNSYTAQILTGLTTELIAVLKDLPRDTRLQISGMLNENEIIKQVLLALRK
jgi:hypothetical protein